MTYAPPAPDKLVPEEFAKLDKAYQCLYVRDPATLFQNEVHAALGDASRSVDAMSSSYYVKTLVQYWFELFKTKMAPTVPISRGSIFDMELVVSMLDEHMLIESMQEHEETRHMLAWACLTIIADREARPAALDIDMLDVLYKQGFTRVKDMEQPLKLEQVVNLIYGPGVWELYATDAESQLKVPSHLYCQGLMPLAAPANTEKTERNTSVDLPPNL